MWPQNPASGPSVTREMMLRALSMPDAAGGSSPPMAPLPAMGAPGPGAGAMPPMMQGGPQTMGGQQPMGQMPMGVPPGMPQPQGGQGGMSSMESIMQQISQIDAVKQALLRR